MLVMPRNNTQYCWKKSVIRPPQLDFQTRFPDWDSELYFQNEILQRISILDFQDGFLDWISKLDFENGLPNQVSGLDFRIKFLNQVS